jgi:glycosyltransferase involved in cell wall biosynthesis
MKSSDTTMLLVLPAPFSVRDGVVHLEEQACNGLRRWLDHFDHLIVAAPVIPPHLISSTAATVIFKDVRDLEAEKRVTLAPLPWAYEVADFVKSYRQTRDLLAGFIRRSRYLQFAIGGVVGDWGALGAMEAIRQKRKYAIHTDRVEHEVILEVTKNSGFARRAKARVTATLMVPYHKHLIQRCSLGLWHGSDCFEAYSPWCEHSFNIHDVHTKPEDCIDDATLQSKLEDVEKSPTINLCYAGRLDPMKAPVEWVKAIGVARDLKVPIKAVWFGDGPLRAETEAAIQELGLNGVIELPGFVRDRPKLLEAMRKSHMLLFTHVTPESPRCLLESLLSGTPIVGYKNKFAAELTESKGGGSFAEIHDWQTLGNRIATLASNRSALRQLTVDAAANGQRFSDVQVFAERSELILKYC